MGRRGESTDGSDASDSGSPRRRRRREAALEQMEEEEARSSAAERQSHIGTHAMPPREDNGHARGKEGHTRRPFPREGYHPQNDRRRDAGFADGRRQGFDGGYRPYGEDDRRRGNRDRAYRPYEGDARGRDRGIGRERRHDWGRGAPGDVRGQPGMHGMRRRPDGDYSTHGRRRSRSRSPHNRRNPRDDNSRHAHNNDAVKQRQPSDALAMPYLVSFREYKAKFCSEDLSEEDALAKHKEYQGQFKRRELSKMFQSQADSMWLKERYLPPFVAKIRDEIIASVATRVPEWLSFTKESAPVYDQPLSGDISCDLEEGVFDAVTSSDNSVYVPCVPSAIGRDQVKEALKGVEGVLGCCWGLPMAQSGYGRRLNVVCKDKECAQAAISALDSKFESVGPLISSRCTAGKQKTVKSALSTLTGIKACAGIFSSVLESLIKFSDGGEDLQALLDQAPIQASKMWWDGMMTKMTESAGAMASEPSLDVSSNRGDFVSSSAELAKNLGEVESGMDSEGQWKEERTELCAALDKIIHACRFVFSIDLYTCQFAENAYELCRLVGPLPPSRLRLASQATPSLEEVAGEVFMLNKRLSDRTATLLHKIKVSQSLPQGFLDSNTNCVIPNGEYRCIICQKAFSAEKFVHKHIMNKHPDEYESAVRDLSLEHLLDDFNSAYALYVKDSSHVGDTRPRFGREEGGYAHNAFPHQPLGRGHPVMPHGHHRPHQMRMQGMHPLGPGRGRFPGPAQAHVRPGPVMPMPHNMPGGPFGPAAGPMPGNMPLSTPFPPVPQIIPGSQIVYDKSIAQATTTDLCLPSYD